MKEKELREYQKLIVNKTLEKINENKNPVICLPTGAGKTVIAFSVIKQLNNNGYNVVFIVPRLELIKQANEEFGEVDMIWSDKTILTGKKCIIASKDSLRTQFQKIPENCIIIFDEVHISLEQSKKLVDLIKPLNVIGLTATPERMDGKALLKGEDDIHKYGIFDCLIQEETVDSLIKKGYLCPLKYYTKPIEGITDIKPDSANGEELSDTQMIEIFDKNQVWGDLVETYQKYGIDENGNKRPALGFTNTIKMAEYVAEIFCNAGYNFKVITGEMTVSKRNELIQQLKNRKIDGLVNSALLTYGFDCPPVSYAFSCRHIKSRPLWFQIVGRILRTCENKTDTVFVDHGDSVSEFSEPNCSLPILDPYISWRINGESKEEKIKRKKAQKKERDSLKILQELDPLPCNMVEIKPEDTWQRMINVLQKLRKENEGLFNLVEKLKNNSESVQKENERLQEEIKKKKNARYIDSEKTFEFVKRNYCITRNKYHEKYCTLKLSPDEKNNLEHSDTVKELWLLGQKQTFLLDENTFNRGMHYWFNHYTYRPQYYS